MPVVETVKPSWADEIEEEVSQSTGKKGLPPVSEVVNGDLKIITEYRYNKNDQMEKVVRTFKIEKRLVSKTIAIRKGWAKFGDSARDKPGPNSATTMVSEEVTIQFITGKDDAEKPEDDLMEKLRAEKSVMKCRVCNGGHWSSKCPYRDTMEKLKPDEKLQPPSALGSGGGMDKSGGGGSKYVPPSLRDGVGGVSKRMDSMGNVRHDALAIRITNLSESTTEADLSELVRSFGPTHKLFLATEKYTGACKGFAYIHFKNREDAQNAINALNGYGYDHLILSVDWSKPTTQN